MSVFDGKMKTLIREDEVKMLLEHDDIKANFYSCPPEVDVLIGNIIAVNFGSHELSQIDYDKNTMEEVFIHAITEKINNYTERDRAEIIGELRMLNAATTKLIYEFRNEAYNKYVEWSENYIGIEDFLNSEYQDKELIEGLIGKEKADYLFKRDPVAGFESKHSIFEKAEFMKINIEEIKKVLRVILENYTADSYNETAGLILSEVTGASPEDVFEDYQNEGIDGIYAKADMLSPDSVKEILDMISTVNLEKVVNEMETNRITMSAGRMSKNYAQPQYDYLMEM